MPIKDNMSYGFIVSYMSYNVIIVLNKITCAFSKCRQYLNYRFNKFLSMKDLSTY